MKFLSRVKMKGRKIPPMLKSSLGYVGTILANLKWIIVSAIIVCALLSVPNQLLELYRAAVAEDGPIRYARFVSSYSVAELLSIFVIGILFWFSAVLIAAQTSQAFPASLGQSPHRVLQALTSAIGAAPILAVGIAQFMALPDLKTPFPLSVGTIIRVEKDLLESIYRRLSLYGCIFVISAIGFAWLAWLLYPRMVPIAARINAAYFTRLRFLITSAVIIFGLVVIVVSFPVSLPQRLGPFVVLATFTLCIVAACVHLSLYAMKYRFPFIPIIMLYALGIMAFDWNDDHFAREISASVEQRAIVAEPRMNAGEAFIKWLQSRTELDAGPAATHGSSSPKPYPVFVITAEGGGIYAAYNAAVFLSRMQDLCPKFNNHIFAISSVSGGSVGAATFLAALNSTTLNQANVSESPCPKITSFLSHSHDEDDLNELGPLEAKIDSALSNDFVSPLVAGLLFPDFFQWFIPKAFGILDRARALEYTLESATDAFYQKPAENIVKASIQGYWKPEGALPALLMNATDTGTGKRIVIAPFNVNENNGSNTIEDNAKDSGDNANTVIASGSGGNSNGRVSDPFQSDFCDLSTDNTAKQFRLSTAAFISARFPWITPAASTDIVNPCMGWTERKPVNETRLVDGGYMDNSGVETALDVINDIKKALVNRDPQLAPLPAFELYVIALAGGDFANSHVYSFGEIAEPIRALLNGREAHSYIAINRANADFNEPFSWSPHAEKKTNKPEQTPPAFNTTKLENYFYPLPLGWAMSSKTRNIVAHESGRFWDCAAGTNFKQTKGYRNNADCVQLEIYNLLNYSAASALADLQQADEIEKGLPQADRISTDQERSNQSFNQAVLGCYEAFWQKQHLDLWQKQQAKYEAANAAWQNVKSGNAPQPPHKFRQRYLAYYQVAHVEALLQEWERRQLSNHENIDHVTLAYVLGAISYDSNDFRRTTDNLSFTSLNEVRRVWKEIDRNNNANLATKPSEALQDLNYLVNNPQGLAELVWGWAKNSFCNNYVEVDCKQDDKTWKGNTGDGWNFRERGIYRIVGRGQYEEANEWLKADDPSFSIDLLDKPYALTNPTVSARVAFLHFLRSRISGKTLTEVLKGDPANFKAARHNQIDMIDPTDPTDPINVNDRSQMFLSCIRPRGH